MQFTCSWCSKPLLNQTLEKWRQSGNICPRCNVDKSNPSMKSIERIRVQHRIKELDELNDGLGSQLDGDIDETTRQFIEDKMRANFEEKKTLKLSLCEK